MVALKQKKIIPVIIAIIAAVAIVSAFYFIEIKEPREIQWISSGPFSIDKSQYKLGENIFLTVHGLNPDEVGNIIFYTPEGKTWKVIPFNGTAKSSFSQYGKPNTNAQLKILEPRELVGMWKVTFQGTEYPPLTFEIIKHYLCIIFCLGYTIRFVG